MTDRDDELIEMLRAANPVPASETAGRRHSDEAEALLAHARRGRVRPRRAVLVAAVILLVLLLIAALGGFFILRRSSAGSPGTVQCLVTGDQRARKVVVAGADPRAACTALWRAGKLGPGPAPDFALCTERRGAVLVIPGESGTTCVRLGLAVVESDNDTIARFIDDLGARLQYGCTKEGPARALALDRIHAFGLTGWQVTVNPGAPFRSDRVCASVSFDTAQRRVLLVALPNNRGK